MLQYFHWLAYKQKQGKINCAYKNFLTAYMKSAYWLIQISCLFRSRYKHFFSRFIYSLIRRSLRLRKSNHMFLPSSHRQTAATKDVMSHPSVYGTQRSKYCKNNLVYCSILLSCVYVSYEFDYRCVLKFTSTNHAATSTKHMKRKTWRVLLVKCCIH
jgi:hypothetical protein